MVQLHIEPDRWTGHHTGESVDVDAQQARSLVRRWPIVATLAAFSCIGAGCTLGPDYARPSLDVPQSYRYANEVATSATHAAPVTPAPTLADVPAWWRDFGDPALDALVQEGLSANHDLAIATARVDEFAALVQASRAEGLPQVGYGAGATRQRAGTGASLAPGNGSPVRTTYSALWSASWELDLWGRIRRQNEAAQANFLASEQARLGVALTLVSAIVTSYVTLLDLDRQLQISQATLDGRRSSVEVFRLRLEGGAVSEFEMMQVTAEYETAAAAIPILEQSIAQQEHALSVLIGRNPGPIKRDRTLQTLVTPPVPAGLPSDLINRRPDILQAEEQLRASNALVGAARALYFPTLSLTASGGTASRELDELFSGPARTWSFTGQLLGPIFSGGAIESANQQALARREQAVHVYQQAVQNAFRDVDDALVAIVSKRALIAALSRQVTALKRAVELTRERYDNGYTDYLEVLDTERSLFSAELQLSSAQGDGYRTLVDLYRALGGDWIARVTPAWPVVPPSSQPSSQQSSVKGQGKDASHAPNTTQAHQ